MKGGMNEMLRQAQIIQRKMTALQEELKTREIEAQSGGGMVSARVTGGKELVALRIDKSVVEAGDVEMLEDLVKAAVNEALRKAGEMVEQEMGQLAGGMKLPGMF
jgi:DNA-binding YbaB/EbfC family protein